MVARMINKNLNPNARVHQTVIFEGSGEVIAHANSQIRAYSVLIVALLLLHMQLMKDL